MPTKNITFLVRLVRRAVKVLIRKGTRVLTAILRSLGNVLLNSLEGFFSTHLRAYLLIAVVAVGVGFALLVKFDPYWLPGLVYMYM